LLAPLLFFLAIFQQTLNGCQKTRKGCCIVCMPIFVFYFTMQQRFFFSIILGLSSWLSAIGQEPALDPFLATAFSQHQRQLERPVLVQEQPRLQPPIIEAPALPHFQQSFTDSIVATPTLDKATIKKRSWLVGGANIAFYGGMMIGLYNAWYSNYPQGKFSSFDDLGEWQQVDKVGHAYSAYWDGRLSIEMWKWTGVKKNTAVWIGGLTGFGYQTAIEVLDGFSAEWGWSWGDMAANAFGSALLIGQELGWDEQKISFKFSIHQRDYGDAGLNNRANKLFGSNILQRLVKDYNAQTYWLSANINSFFKQSKLPDWLNIAVGYGADNMFGGYENVETDKNGVVVFDRRDLPRYRQWYLAPDIDFSRIKTKSKWLKRFLFCLNALKMPSPSLEFSNGSFKFNWLTF
jgi:hypothetical protein